MWAWRTLRLALLAHMLAIVRTWGVRRLLLLLVILLIMVLWLILLMVSMLRARKPAAGRPAAGTAAPLATLAPVGCTLTLRTTRIVLGATAPSLALTLLWWRRTRLQGLVNHRANQLAES